ncbi:MAG: cytochrome c peroxidase [Isosphaeraceae bacterium]
MPDLGRIQDKPLKVETVLGLPELTPSAVVPVGNPLTEAKFELGKLLYFDARISKDETISCATCHNPDKGWTDQLPTSIGIKGQHGSRNAPTVLNTVYGKLMFWDGRAPSLEGQSQGPPRNAIEMGDQTFDDIVKRLRKIPGYRERFKKVFGTDVTIDGISKAIATFERAAALSGDSAYDRYVKGESNALTESQKRGMVLFGLELNEDESFKPGVPRGKAKCTACHVGFNFSDDQFHNLGVGWDAKTGKYADSGRFGATPIGAKFLADLGAFKTPTIRDIEHTAPYMHDGSEDTLEKVVDFYDRGGNPNPQLDRDIVKLNLSPQDKSDLIAFLKSLTGKKRDVALPSLPPGPDGKAPDPKAALTPPSPRKEKAASNSTDPHAVFAGR